MCLGSEERAANERARRDYQYKLQKREAEWMQTLSLTGVERVQYEQGINASNLGLAQTYGDLQAKFGDEIGEALQSDEAQWRKFLENNTGAQLAASGRTGRSAERVASRDFAAYLADSSRKAFELTQTKETLDRKGQEAAGQARAEQMQMFTKNAFVKVPGIEPPKPVMQNESAGAFRDALSIAGSVATTAASLAYLAGSDRRLKENIQKIGESISGLGIYKFNYIGKAKQYIGTMADEVIKVVPEAVVKMDNGYLGVNYNLIDVDFKEA